MSYYFTGIGSRKIGKSFDSIYLAKLASYFAKEGFIVRHGDAVGSDRIFRDEFRNRGKQEIYIPWKSFIDDYDYSADMGDCVLGEINVYCISDYDKKSIKEINHILKECGLYFKKESTTKLVQRNVLQVLGKDLQTPSEFVICWTPDGAESLKDISKDTGGSRVAIGVADLFDIPVYNIKNNDTLEYITDVIGINLLE